MKIAIADNTGFKFTQDLYDYWISQGHEVRREVGASEVLAQWADIYWVDFWDNNIHYLYKLYHPEEHPDDVSRTPDWDNNRKPLIVCRAIDWEVWVGLARDQRIIDWVDKVVCIAPHIKKKLESENDWGDKIRLIRPGVNLEKFTLKTKETDGFQLGMCLGDLWWYKNHMGGLDIFKTLYDQDNRWRLHIRGQHESGDYNPVMFEHYLESRGIKDVVFLYPKIEDINAWYEQLDILLHPGMKETFTYAVGECLAKGIPVAVNEFYGSRDVWDHAFIYQTHEQAVAKIKIYNQMFGIEQMHDPRTYRTYIENHYPFSQMAQEIDEYLDIKSN